MQIEQKYVIGSVIFDSLEEAEQYLAESKDQQRIDAFCDHLRANGAIRISRTVSETLEEFIKFENGFYDTEEGSVELETKRATRTVVDEDEDEDEEPEASEDPAEEAAAVALDKASLFAVSDDADEEEDTEEEIPAAIIEAAEIPKGKSLFGA